MPYDTNSELPKLVRDHLPEHAQTIYREAFNHAWVQYAHDPAHEEIAHRVAWSAVNRRFRKAGDRRATMAPAEPLAPEALYRRGAFWMARRRRWIDLLQQDEQPRSSLRAALEVDRRLRAGQHLALTLEYLNQDMVAGLLDEDTPPQQTVLLRLELLRAPPS